ncbi:hypothetical protein TNCV_534341 [Trichonephila clavipes]|nr:hypothetical protein TNCV_534341 [Trichonephila clavipes]
MFHFLEFANASSVRYLLAEVHGTIAICMGTAEVNEEYCRQMMVVSPIVWQLHEHCWSLKLLRTQSLPFRQQCRVHVAFKHGRPAPARSSNFPVSSKRLTSFKIPAGVKGPFYSSHFLKSEFTQGNGR